MTTIAYRDGILASDSLWSGDDSVVSLRNKVHRLHTGALYGSSGDVDDRALFALVKDVEDARMLPTAAELAALNLDIRALWVSQFGEVWRIETKNGEDSAAGVCPINMPFFAIGSGKQFAMGAMAQGASAWIAVAVACRFDLYSREPIHIAALQPTLDEICATTYSAGASATLG